MKHGNLLSIIVPVYNGEKYLDRCVQSLLKQDYKEIEIVLVDDGSLDSSGALCDTYANEYQQIKVIHQKNGGLGAARNTGVAVAQGGYIAFVDSDDWVKPDMFAKLMRETVAHPEAEMIKCGYCETDGISQEKAILFPGDSYQQIAEEENLCKYYGKGAPWVVAWNTIYRQDLAKRVEFPAGLYHEDNYASFFYLYFSRNCVIINEPLYCYWQNPASITRDAEKMSKRNRDKVEVTKRLLEYAAGQAQLRSSFMYRKLQKLWARAYFHLIRDDKSIKNLPQGEWMAIYRNLDWRRRLQLRYIALRRGIRTDVES